MSSAPSHVPFASAYRPDFAVVTERRGRFTLFPHTQQLPLLHRALNLEFYSALPDYIARVDRRGNSFQKHLLRQAMLYFCNLFNAARTDGLHLETMPDADLVSRLMVVQQITEDTRRGRLHRFKFYGGADFQPDIRISARGLAFTEHIIERFTQRVPNKAGEHLSCFLLALFGSPLIALPAGKGSALVLPYLNSLIALPMELEHDELVFTTCLTINELNTLELQLPPLAFHAHYGDRYEVPRIRHWVPAAHMANLHKLWRNKAALPPPAEPIPPELRWRRVAHMIRDLEVAKGCGPGMTFCFLDHVPGPYAVHYPANVPEPRFDERAMCKTHDPAPDWDRVFDHRDHFIVHFTNPPLPPGP